VSLFREKYWSALTLSNAPADSVIRELKAELRDAAAPGKKP
jgi:hypothetical protein